MIDGIEAAHEKGIVHRDLKRISVYATEAQPSLEVILNWGKTASTK